MGGTGQAGARFGQQFLQKSLGKKLSQEIGSGVNPVSGDGKIYSRDEIAKLTTDEYIKLEPEIISQLNTIGIPTEKELEKYTAAGDLIYVHPYTRSDGTKVRGYYRAAR